MTDIDALIARYVAMFNEPDPDQRRALVATVFAEGALNATRANEWRGREALFERVSRSHAVSNVEGGCYFTPFGAPVSHHGAARFRWRMLTQGTDAVRAEGIEFLLLDEAGLIREDYQFVEPAGA